MKYKNIVMTVAVAFLATVIFNSNNLWAEVGDMESHSHGDGDMKAMDKKENKKSVGEIIYACPMHPEVTSHKEGESCPKCGMILVAPDGTMNKIEEDKESKDDSKGHEIKKSKSSDRKEKSDKQRMAVYVCPMHPEVTSHKEGERCTKCGMHLVAIDAQSSLGFESKVEGRTAVAMDYYKEQKIGVKTIKAVQKQLFKSIKAPGRVAFDPELYTAQSEYIEALKQWDRVRKSPLKEVKRSTREMISATETRLKILGLPDSEIRQLKKKKHLSESLLLSKGGEGWIYADIFEMDIPFILKGQSAEVSAKFLMGEVLAAKVISVDEVINLETRTAKVRLKLKKGGPKIRPQSYVSVDILVPSGEHVAVPRDAVLDTGRETFVFVKTGDGVFEPRPVVVMFEAEGMVAIASGLSDGEDVVSQGNFMLDSEARLQSVFSKSAGVDLGEHAGH